jgi:hypothetical protein
VEILLEPEVPAIEVVQGFRSIERAARQGACNAVQALEGAHPQKRLLVPGSWLPSQMIWPFLEITPSFKPVILRDYF